MNENKNKNFRKLFALGIEHTNNCHKSSNAYICVEKNYIKCNCGWKFEINNYKGEN